MTFSDSITAVVGYDSDAAENLHFQDIQESCRGKQNFTAKAREQVQIKLKITTKPLPRSYSVIPSL